MRKVSKSTKQYISRAWPLSAPPSNERHLWIGLRYGRKRAQKAKRVWSIDDMEGGE